MKISFLNSSNNNFYIQKSENQLEGSSGSPLLIRNSSFSNKKTLSFKKIRFHSSLSSIINGMSYRRLKIFYAESKNMTPGDIDYMYKISQKDFFAEIQKRIEHLMPIEFLKSADYIKKFRVGSSTVLDKKTSSPVQAVFTLEEEKVMVFIRDLPVGEMRIIPFRNSIYLSDMYSYCNDEYKGVGTALHRFAVEYSLKTGLNGRVSLDTARSGAKLFHYKSGFRATGPDANEFNQTAQMVVKGDMEEFFLGDNPIDMSLSKEAINKYNEEISKSPIINEGAQLGAFSFQILSKLLKIIYKYIFQFKHNNICDKI